MSEPVAQLLEPRLDFALFRGLRHRHVLVAGDDLRRYRRRKRGCLGWLQLLQQLVSQKLHVSLRDCPSSSHPPAPISAWVPAFAGKTKGRCVSSTLPRRRRDFEIEQP